MSQKLVVKSYPNNEIRATFQRESRPRNWNTAPGDSGIDADDGAVSGRPQSCPLDITLKLSDPLKPGFGGEPRPTKFGNNARRTISRASGVFERDGDRPEEFVFLTGTIPGSTREAFDAVACYSSWAVKSIKTWISDKGILSAYSLYVWEFQKRGALHIHYCVQVKSAAESAWLIKNWKKKWTEVIDAISEKSGVDCWKINGFRSWKNKKDVLQADAQKVRKSVGAYLSKYLSKKTPTPIKGRYGSRPFLCPVRWWGCSRPLLKRMRELTESFEFESIPQSRIEWLKDVVVLALRGSGNDVYSYWDKAKSTNVLLTYSPCSWQIIYNELWRDLHGFFRRAIRPISSISSQSEISARISLSPGSKAALYNAGVLVCD